MTTTTTTTTTELALPYNATTGDPYTGSNVVRLAAAAAAEGYAGGEWAGFRQWRKLGRTVRRGEHGTRVLMIVTRKGGDGERATSPRMVPVFHRAQTDEVGA